MRVNDRGSTLVAALFLVVFLAGICAALSSVSLATYRGTQRIADLHDAARSAESGVAYYLSRLELEVNTFVTDPAPHDPLPLGDGTFQLISASPGSAAGQWTLGVETNVDSTEYRMFAVVGFRQYSFPQGLVVGGTGSPSDTTLKIAGAGALASYDPTVGPSVSNDNAGVWVNGSVEMNGNTSLMGDVTATGSIDVGSNSDLTGTTNANGPPAPVDDFSEFAAPIVADAQAANDNDTLAAIFGAQWQSVGGDPNAGDLEISGGTYVIPPGTYNIRNLSISGGASVTFDTSAGPSTVVFTGTDNDTLSLSGGSTVQIDPGGTTNGLMTVLGENSNFHVTSGSEFGQAIGDPYNSGYSQILSAGGTGTVALKGTSQVYGRLGAPNLDLHVGGAASWYGSAVVRTATLAGSNTFAPKFNVDEGTQGSVLTDPEQFEVYSQWRDTPAPPTTGSEPLPQS